MSGAGRLAVVFRAVFLPSRPEKRRVVNADARIARQDARFSKLTGIPSADSRARPGGWRGLGALARMPRLTKRSMSFETAAPG